MTKENIIDNLNDPDELERLYRKDKKSFSTAFSRIPEKTIGASYKFWQARFQFDLVNSSANISTIEPKKDPSLLLIVLLAVLAGTILKIPDFFKIDENFFYPRFTGFALFPALSVYFLLRNKLNKRLVYVIAFTFLVAALYMIFIPHVEKSDTIMLSCLHLPFFLWTLTGLVFVSNEPKNIDKRIEYIKYNGELAIYTVLLLLAGILLTGFTAWLFLEIKIDITKVYLKWIAIYGAAASPIAGAHLAALRGRRNDRISPIIARIFAPLFLFTIIVYIVVVVLQKKNPYTDRDFLTVFNVMLLLILAISIFSITEKSIGKGQQWIDIVVMALLVVGVIVNFIALSAILFRLGSYGFTPNRTAVLGANLIICVNVIGLIYFNGQQLRGRKGPEDVTRWIGRFLPVYMVWTSFVVFLFPLIFGLS